ncbi:hypothetical protein [Buchnera aphidicola]
MNTFYESIRLIETICPLGILIIAQSFSIPCITFFLILLKYFSMI